MWSYLRLVYALPYKNPGNYIRFSETLAKSLKDDKGVFWANQFDNYQQKSHYLTTGPEIAKPIKFNIDGFICAIGTGGTISGVSEFLKEK